MRRAVMTGKRRLLLTRLGCSVVCDLRQRPLTRWSRQTHLELAALPSAVPCARGHARSVALEWGLTDLAQTTELLVSELITNAIHASHRLTASEQPVVRLWLSSDENSIVIHVWDGNSEMPVRRDTGPDAEGGRGLLLVEALGADWGAYRKANGKVVWVMIGVIHNP
jgi:anti-sigma regulatory factor (Ser/Thr protein kinase)